MINVNVVADLIIRRVGIKTSSGIENVSSLLYRPKRRVSWSMSRPQSQTRTTSSNSLPFLEDTVRIEHHVNDAEGSSQSARGSLHRGLSARQVQMIAIGGTIGTGLFLGTGRSLAQGGPASMLICYGIVGFIVYITLLLLGEMATQYPVAGEFFIFHFDVIITSGSPRVIQCLCNTLFLPILWFCPFVELLVQ